MKNILLTTALIALAFPALADETTTANSDSEHGHEASSGHDHGDDDHGDMMANDEMMESAMMHHEEAAKSDREILYWVAPMDSEFRSDKPGKSPMGMALVPVYEEEQDEQDENEAHGEHNH